MASPNIKVQIYRNQEGSAVSYVARRMSGVLYDRKNDRLAGAGDEPAFWDSRLPGGRQSPEVERVWQAVDALAGHRKQEASGVRVVFPRRSGVSREQLDQAATIALEQLVERTGAPGHVARQTGRSAYEVFLACGRIEGRQLVRMPESEMKQHLSGEVLAECWDDSIEEAADELDTAPAASGP